MDKKELGVSTQSRGLQNTMKAHELPSFLWELFVKLCTVKLLAGYSGPACHPSTQEAEVQGPGDGEFKASLAYMVTCLKKPKWGGSLLLLLFLLTLKWEVFLDTICLVNKHCLFPKR